MSHPRISTRPQSVMFLLRLSITMVTIPCLKVRLVRNSMRPLPSRALPLNKRAKLSSRRCTKPKPRRLLMMSQQMRLHQLLY